MSFASGCKQQLLRVVMTLQQDVSKVSLIIWNIFADYYNRCFILSRMVLFSTLYAHGTISYGRIIKCV